MATVAAGIRVRGVVFDLAGTVVDYGSIAPVVAFVKLFASARINISVETARRPMGSNKRDHIAAIAREMAGEWTAKYGAAASEANIDELYRAFTPLQLAAVKERAKPIPGAVATFETLRRRWGCRIGGCTGYHAPIVEALVPAMAANGLRFDAVECANAAGTNGRPKPWLSTRVAEAMDAYPLTSLVKVDDTLVGIGEGLNAGMITVGVVKSGNEVGLDEHEVAAMPHAELDARLVAGYKRMYDAGAHFVIDTVAELPSVIEHIHRWGAPRHAAAQLR